jgi:hypothetical protein
LTDELSTIPRALREQNVMIPGIGPLSIFDLATVGVAAVTGYNRADAEPPPEEPKAPPVSADADEPDPLDKAEEKLAELSDKLAEAEAAQKQADLDAALDHLETRGTGLEERSGAIQAALEAGDVSALASLVPGYSDLCEDGD